MGRWYLRDYAGRPGFTMDGDIDVPAYATQPDEAFFWSGRTTDSFGAHFGGRFDAAEIAESRGGVTLELLQEHRGIDLPEWDDLDDAVVGVWGDASAAYAEGVSGRVRAVIGNELRANNIWRGIELDRLTANAAVTQIIEIDPLTAVERVVYP